MVGRMSHQAAHGACGPITGPDWQGNRHREATQATIRILCRAKARAAKATVPGMDLAEGKGGADVASRLPLVELQRAAGPV